MSRRRVVIIGAVAVAGAAAVVAALFVGGGGPGGPTTTPTTSAPPPGRTLVVKIDNVADARPQTGLGAADVVYVEPVEGGLTRLVAVYSRNPPPVIGPVRSARPTDVELLAQYGRPTLVYSGAAPELLPALHSASLTNASPAENAGAFYRSGPHAAPHDLYLRPARLPAGAGKSVAEVLAFGRAPAGGQPSSVEQARYPSADYRFQWAGSRWTVTLDGTPVLSTESGPVAAATVVVQRVTVHPADFVDADGHPAQIADTVGSGPVTVLRDGQSFTGTWSRPDAASPTTFSTTNGTPVPMAAGPVWILLLPA